MKELRRRLFTLLLTLERNYYNLSSRPRRVVGWLLVVLMLSAVVGVGYGVFQCGRAVVHGVTAVWQRISAPDDDDSPADATDQWSDGWRRHHMFPVAEADKHPKRRMNLSRDFNDINDTHLSAARKLGISPLANRDELTGVLNRLVELHDTRYYIIDSLTSSVPYLVPRAADFLTALGQLMQEYNGTKSRFIITSVLRTQRDVGMLRRYNTNSSPNSAHCYATTFDITYNRFDVHGHTWEGPLKEDLARALFDLRARGYCYVKYEYRQACFHVTVRP